AGVGCDVIEAVGQTMTQFAAVATASDIAQQTTLRPSVFTVLRMEDVWFRLIFFLELQVPLYPSRNRP
ncbi:hypothetical protein, partial [Sphingomonas sp. CCH15-F11]|uniref:hypothetical protein n=1 Tax=Sphingomonas sp. CCH15-F11 TaxID=1768785 RepID=UPI001E339D5C